MRRGDIEEALEQPLAVGVGAREERVVGSDELAAHHGGGELGMELERIQNSRRVLETQRLDARPGDLAVVDFPKSSRGSASSTTSSWWCAMK